MGNMYCGEWINKPWTFDVQTEVPALMVGDSLCDVDYPSFSASPNYGGDWVYAGRFNERSAWKKVIGTETRWIVYLTTEQLESGWDSRWVVYRNAPSLQWIGFILNIKFPTWSSLVAHVMVVLVDLLNTKANSMEKTFGSTGPIIGLCFCQLQNFLIIGR